MVSGCLQWDVELINDLFCSRDVDAILSIQLCPIAAADKCVWHFSKTREYIVRSAYRLAMEQLAYDFHFHVPSEWRGLWKLQVPPKVKNFVWRTTQEILPNREALWNHGINVPSTYTFVQWLFSIVRTLQDQVASTIVMVLWSIWRERTERFWNNTLRPANSMVFHGLECLYEWLQAKDQPARVFHALVGCV
ncbi:hypothetical protein PTKIN_Ptkin01aG0247600 [Pterospermum kingtungense]